MLSAKIEIFEKIEFTLKPFPLTIGFLRMLQYHSSHFICRTTTLFAINQLSGPIPIELGSLTTLQYLGLYLNQLDGGIPVELGNLINLTSMNFFSNQRSRAREA